MFVLVIFESQKANTEILLKAVLFLPKMFCAKSGKTLETSGQPHFLVL